MVITPPPFLEGHYECHVIRGEYTSYVNNFFFIYKTPHKYSAKKVNIQVVYVESFQ